MKFYRCPVCGKIISTQERIYRLGKREIVDIPFDEFEEKASVFGYFTGCLEEFTQFLPNTVHSAERKDMVSLLTELKETQPEEIGKIIDGIIAYLEGSEAIFAQKSAVYRKALANAGDLCKVFGHDVPNLETRCRCCGQSFNRAKLLEEYQNAILSGVVDFPYLHRDSLDLYVDEESPIDLDSLRFWFD